MFNVTVENATDYVVWTYGPSNLDSHGEAWIIMSTNGLPAGDYSIKAMVDNMKYVEEDAYSFEIVVRTFDIFADVTPESNAGYVMPLLDITTVPGQASNLTFTVYGYWPIYGDYYSFTKTNFDVSSYQYFLPLSGMVNGTYNVEVTVDSASGTNSTWSSFSYSGGIDKDGDGLLDTEELSKGTNLNNYDTDGDGFFDGIEVFHGSDPKNPASVIPEFTNVLQLIIVLSMIPVFLYIAVRKRKISYNHKHM